MGGKVFKNIWKIAKVCGAVVTLLLAIVYIAAAYGGMVDPAEDTQYAIFCLGYPLFL